MSNPNPIDPIRNICERLKEEADKIGLNLYQVALIPHAADVQQPDMLQCVFVLKPESLLGEDEIEQIGIDQQFEELVNGFNRDAAKDKFEEKKESAAEDLKKWLEGME